MNKESVRLEPQQISAAEAVLSRGDRVELVPGPNGAVKLLRVRRNVINPGQGMDCRKG